MTPDGEKARRDVGGIPWVAGSPPPGPPTDWVKLLLDATEGEPVTLSVRWLSDDEWDEQAEEMWKDGWR